MTDLSFLMQEDDIPKPGYCIFDFSQIALATSQHYFASGEEKVTLDNVRHLILASLKFNVIKARSEGYEKIILALDNAKNGYWRRDEAYYYKLNRAKAREESTFDWEAYFNALHQVISEFKEFMPYQVIDVDKGEADDIIGVLTKYLSLKGHKVRIVSSDGDFPQLQKYPNVTQWSPMQKKFVKPKTGSPELDCMVKIIKGDRKDCVASIKVRSDFYHTMVEGERTPPTRMDFIESILDAGSDEERAKLMTEEQYKRFLENRVLIDFDYIREDIKDEIFNQFTNNTPAPRGKMYKYFVKNGLVKFIKDLDKF
ncbi:RNaseH ribonuclease [Acinetobacter phage Ac42]|uniref:RNaseH ribonuclease n=1 Tax=Acinetobacter phage Ac42 TaxID=762660 RepID=UPI0001EBCE1A|nr:RNaseH ribonuclease [Acinetobacter phage Ac42]ADI96478.1 RNaseH ribonuclease [Acinetobacter phage Ac42]